MSETPITDADEEDSPLGRTIRSSTGRLLELAITEKTAEAAALTAELTRCQEMFVKQCEETTSTQQALRNCENARLKQNAESNAEIAALTKERDTAQDNRQQYQDDGLRLLRERDAALAANADLLKDKSRMDWLDDNAIEINLTLERVMQFGYDPIRPVIDAALSQPSPDKKG